MDDIAANLTGWHHRHVVVSLLRPPHRQAPASSHDRPNTDKCSCLEIPAASV